MVSAVFADEHGSHVDRRNNNARRLDLRDGELAGSNHGQITIKPQPDAALDVSVGRRCSDAHG